MKSLINKLKQQGIELRGIDSKLILKLENHFGNKFPSEYRLFLSTMGNGAGKFMLGSSAFGKDLLHMKESAEELLEENNFKSMPKDAFVFWMHQGYQMAFFKFNDGENPRVFTFAEGNNQTEFRKVESIEKFFKIQAELSGVI